MRIMWVLMLLLSAPLLGQTLAIKNATVHTLSGIGSVENGSIIIEDGVITAIGADVEIPANAELIDAAGKVVTPGLFDPSSYLGVVEIDLVEQTVDNRQQGRFSAAFDVAPALNPRSTLIPINRIEGITRTVVAPAPAAENASLFSGLGALINLGNQDVLEQERVAMFAQLGETGSGLAGGSRASAVLGLREALEDARDYRNHRSAYEEGRRRDYALNRYDLEALQAVLARDIPLVVTVNRASDISQLLDLAERERIEVVVRGGAEAWMLAGRLAAADVPVIMDPTRNLPESFDTLSASLAAAARLSEAGVAVAFSLSDSHNSRNIRQLAGNAVASGMDWGTALAAITRIPARIYNDRRGGRLEVGNPAELVVWSGDPLEVTTAAEHVFIDGETIPMHSRQTLLRDRYMELNPRLPHAYPR